MKKLIFVLLLCPLFVTRCYADSVIEQAAQMSGAAAVADALDEDARLIGGDLRLDGSYDTQGALSRLWDHILSLARQRVQQELRFALKLIAIAFVCALAMSFTGQKNTHRFISIIGCCAAALLIIGDMDGVTALAVDALNRLSDYSKAAMPVLFTAAAACGAVTSASARYAAACLAMDVLVSAAQRLILPMICAYLAVAVSRSLFDNAVLHTGAQILKWGITTAMTLLTLVFTAYINITGIISGSADALAVKTARTLISGTLPVVGGILSDSANVVLSAAALIKNSAGAFSLVAVCALCAGPFVLLTVKMLFFKAAAAVTDMLPGAGLSKLIGDVGTALGMLLGLAGCCGILLFVSIMSGIRVATA